MMDPTAVRSAGIPSPATAGSGQALPACGLVRFLDSDGVHRTPAIGDGRATVGNGHTALADLLDWNGAVR